LNKFHKALSYLNKVLKINSTYVSAIVDKGAIFVDVLKQNKKGILLFKKALKMEPQHTVALHNMGVAYINLSKFKTAIKYLKMVLDVDPNHVDALSKIGMTYGAKLRRYKKGISYLDKCVIKQPRNPRFLKLRAVLLMRQKQYAKAESDLNRALHETPNDVEVLYDKSCLMSLKGDHDNAILLLTNVIDKNPTYKELARDDDDFNNLKYDPRFLQLIS